MACKFCNNATIDPELTSDNDLSYIPLGVCERGYRVYLRSGDGRPTEIIFENVKLEVHDALVAFYTPKFCPECGRELTENKAWTERQRRR